VIAFVASVRLLSIYDQPAYAKNGGMVAYGPLLIEHYVMAAEYVGKILKGAKPADLPVEQPTRIDLVIKPRMRSGPRFRSRSCYARTRCFSKGSIRRHRT